MAGEKEYKRLSSARYWFRIASLYQGKDHLLLVQSTGFSEEYKRFYFRDIQVLLLRPSPRLLVWSAVWALLSLGFGWLAYLAYGPHYSPGSVTLWFFPVFCLLCLGINLGLGPSCACHVKTAIQTVEVPLTRFRQAGKIIAKLRPLIEQTQQNLPEGQPGGTPGDSPAGAVSPAGSAQPLPPVLKPFQPGAHWALFTLLAASSAFEAFRFVRPSDWLFQVEVIIQLGAVWACLAAWVGQGASDAPPMLRKVTWGAFLFLAAYAGVFLVDHAFIHRSMMGLWASMRRAALQPPDATPWQLFMSGTFLLGGLLFGLLGLVELALYQKRKRPI